MLKDLIKLANHLDNIGRTKEADYLDRAITRMAQEALPANFDEGGDTKATAVITANILDSTGELAEGPGYQKGAQHDFVVKITLNNKSGELGVVSATSEGGMEKSLKDAMIKLEGLLSQNGLDKSDVKLEIDTDQIKAKNAITSLLTQEVTKGYSY